MSSSSPGTTGTPGHQAKAGEPPVVAPPLTVTPQCWSQPAPPQCSPKTGVGGTLRGAAAGEDSVTSATLSVGMLSTGTEMETRPQTSSTGRSGGEQNRRERSASTLQTKGWDSGRRGRVILGTDPAEGRKRGWGRAARPGHPCPSQPSPSLQGRARGHRDLAPVTAGIKAPGDPGGGTEAAPGTQHRRPACRNPPQPALCGFRFSSSLKQEAENSALGAGRSRAAWRIKVSAGAALRPPRGRARFEPTPPAAGSTGLAPV